MATSIFNNMHKRFSSSAMQIDDKSAVTDMDVWGVLAWRVLLMMAERQA